MKTMLKVNGNQKLRDLRLERHLTMPQLAKLCGVHKNTIANIERDGQQPNLETCKRICAVLDVNLEDVF